MCHGLHVVDPGPNIIEVFTIAGVIEVVGDANSYGICTHPRDIRINRASDITLTTFKLQTINGASSLSTVISRRFSSRFAYNFQKRVFAGVERTIPDINPHDFRIAAVTVTTSTFCGRFHVNLNDFTCNIHVSCN